MRQKKCKKPLLVSRNLNPSLLSFSPSHYVEMRERAGKKRINDGSLPDITKMKKQTRFKMFHDGLYALKAETSGRREHFLWKLAHLWCVLDSSGGGGLREDYSTSGKETRILGPDLNIFWEDCGRSIKRIAADVIPGLIFLRRFNKEGKRENSFFLRIFKRNETSIRYIERGGCKLNILVFFSDSFFSWSFRV